MQAAAGAVFTGAGSADQKLGKSSTAAANKGANKARFDLISVTIKLQYSLCPYFVLDLPVLRVCSRWLVATPDAIAASVLPWSVQHCSAAVLASCSSERTASRSKASLADLRLSSHVCVPNEIAAAKGFVLVTGATSPEPRARLWPCNCGMSTC